MPKETASHINQLVATNPDGADPKTQGDDHIRMIKQVLLTDFPNIAGAVTADHTELSYCDGVTSAIQTQINTVNSNISGLSSSKVAKSGDTMTGALNWAAYGTNCITNGNGDAASYATHNLIIRTWYGLGIHDNADTCRMVIDARTGSISGQGTATFANLSLSNNATVSGALTVTGATALNGGATVPTKVTSDNSTSVSSTAFVANRIAQDVPWADTATGGRVRYATSSEAQDFGNATVTLSPSALDQAYRGGNQGTRWQRLPGGRYRQWYSVAIGDIAIGTPGSAWSISFDIAFPSGVLGFSVQLYDAAGQGAAAPMVTGYSQWGINGYIEEWAALSQNATLFITVDGQ